MALMEWNDSYSVGVESMDKQHRMLIDSLNELHSAMLNGRAHQMTGELLEKLVKYTNYHFHSEEEIMKAANFPDFDAHHQKHEDLVKEVNVFLDRYRSGEELINLHLMTFLRDWLNSHILGVDQEYGKWISRSASN
jgi:hemerythrin-like metal-binding protein